MTWVADQDWEVNAESVEAQGRNVTTELTDRIGDGFELEGPADETFLKDRWVIWWYPKKGGMPRGKKLYSTHLCREVLRKAFHYKGSTENLDTVLRSENPPPDPFDVNEPGFVESFVSVLSREKYAALREQDDYDDSWFEPRITLIANFWLDVKADYLGRIQPHIRQLG